SNGLPTGITLVGSAYQEAYLISLGNVLHRQQVSQLGATEFTFADLEKMHH
ncbi:MAG: hypothetical protein F6K11_25045, partial [Leptolyngbya sp. SIO3F4]|nr:hypothetical protein [Leptolyngbya sp. SIO3F4]